MVIRWVRRITCCWRLWLFFWGWHFGIAGPTGAAAPAALDAEPVPAAAAEKRPAARIGNRESASRIGNQIEKSAAKQPGKRKRSPAVLESALHCNRSRKTIGTDRLVSERKILWVEVEAISGRIKRMKHLEKETTTP